MKARKTKTVVSLRREDLIDVVDKLYLAYQISRSTSLSLSVLRDDEFGPMIKAALQVQQVELEQAIAELGY
jgi:hypothetical protein